MGVEGRSSAAIRSPDERAIEHRRRAMRGCEPVRHATTSKPAPTRTSTELDLFRAAHGKLGRRRATESPVTNNSDIVFPPAARRAQAERGSARHLRAARRRRISGHASRRSSPPSSPGSTPHFSRTVSAAGAPYIQHRGGPKGFIKVLDEKTLGFADYARQPAIHHASATSPATTAPTCSCSISPTRRRIKIWGRARVVENDPA